MNEAVKQWGPLVGRILLGLIFLMSGIGKITGFAGQAAYAAKSGVPLPEVAIALSIVAEVGGALMIMLGWKARIGAAILFVWMIPVNFYMHAFWNIADATWKQIHMIMFLKNLAMMGGMLLVMANGSGPKSLKND